MFEIDVVSSPGAVLYPTTPMWDAPLAELRAYDEDLIKPMVLFADKITLRSERLDLLARVNSLGMQRYSMPLRRVTEFVALSKRRDPAELDLLGVTPEILADPADVERILGLPRADDDELEAIKRALFSFERKYRAQIDETAEAALDLLRQRRIDLTSPALQALTDAGLLASTGWAAGDSTPWALAWESEAEFFGRTVADVAAHLATSSGAVMLEPGSQFLLGRERPQSPTVLASGVAASFVGRLPGLQTADLGDLLEVREDLKEYLVPFRAAMATLTADIATTTDASSQALVDEIDHRWHVEIAPVIHELEIKTRRGGYPRQLLNVLVEDRTALATTATSVVMAAGSLVAGLTTLIPAAAAATVPFAKAFNEALRGREELSTNQLYFLYAAKRRLATEKK